jgi:hypothetical protein
MQLSLRLHKHISRWYSWRGSVLVRRRWWRQVAALVLSRMALSPAASVTACATVPNICARHAGHSIPVLVRSGTMHSILRCRAAALGAHTSILSWPGLEVRSSSLVSPQCFTPRCCACSVLPDPDAHCHACCAVRDTAVLRSYARSAPTRRSSTPEKCGALKSCHEGTANTRSPGTGNMEQLARWAARQKSVCSALRTAQLA